MDLSDTYTVDEAVTINGQQWAGIDAPLGDVGDRLPFKLTVALVAATTPECQAVLNAKVDATDPTVGAVLPPGCVELDQVEVNVSQP